MCTMDVAALAVLNFVAFYDGSGPRRDSSSMNIVRSRARVSIHAANEFLVKPVR